jgi:hypothetical protein
MVVNFSPKQPWEEYYLEFDFSRDFGEEAIVSAEVSFSPLIEDSAGVPLIDEERQALEAARVLFWVQGGESGTVYRIECRVVGEDGSRYEMEGDILVLER